MVMAKNIMNTKKIAKALCFAMLFVVLSVFASISFAQETSQVTGATTIKKSIEGKAAEATAPKEIAPNYYAQEDITTNEDGSQTIKNGKKFFGGRDYDEKDQEHLLNVAKKGASSEELANLMAAYPSTLGLVEYVPPTSSPSTGMPIGSGYYVLNHEYDVMKNLKQELDDGKLSKEEYDKIFKNLTEAFDRHTAFYATGTKNEGFAQDRINRISGQLKRGEINESDANRRMAEMQKVAQGIKDAKVEHFTNEECVISDMKNKYQSSCYSCIIVKTLITTFMAAGAKTYDITRQAGVAVLFVGAILWMAIFGLKSVSAFTNQDPEKNLDDLLSLLFKVLIAYVVITAGINVIIYYFINPILSTGADYGLGILRSSQASLGLVNVQNIPDTAYKYTDDTLVSAAVINKLLALNQAIDREVSTNLVVGEALMCHAFNAGMIKVGWESINITIPDLWIWLCGAAIWFVGFMLTLAVSYYLLDVSFKLGFAIIALPVVIGLWPFAPTKDKLKTCMSIIIGAAGTFAFLAITTSYALVLIGESIRGVDELYARIEKNDAKWIEVTFALTGSYFLIIIFSYLYAMKLIMSTVTDFSNKFFGDDVFGGASPMHSQATMYTHMASTAAVGAAKGATKAVGAGAGKVGKFIGEKFKGSDSKKAEDENKKGGKNALQSGGQGVKSAGEGVESAGKGTKQAGKAVEQTGKAAEQAGKATKQVGESVNKAGEGVTKGGQGMIKGGVALSGTGLGAIVGVPMIIAGAAVTAGGAATQVAGKAVKAAGSVVEQTGKIVKNAGKAVRKVGEGIEKVGKRISKAGDKVKSVGDKWRTKGDDMRQGKDGNDGGSNNEQNNNG